METPNYFEELEQLEVNLPENSLEIGGNPGEMMSFEFIEPKTLNEQNIEYMKTFIKDEIDDYENKLFYVRATFGNEMEGGFFDFGLNDGWDSFNDLSLGDPRLLYLHVNLSLIFAFDIFFVEKPSEEGGNDKYNMCLYKSLKSILNESLKLKNKGIKNCVGVDFEDKVPVSKLYKLEDKIKTNIIVSGDVEYMGAQKYNQSAYLKLEKGHYTPIVSTNDKCSKFFKDEIPVEIVSYDRSERYQPKKAKFSHLVLQSRDDYLKKKPLQTTYEEITKQYDELKQLSKGKFNPYNFISIPQMAYSIFYKNFSGVKPDPIEPHEALWITRANNGGFRVAKVGIYKKGYSYDINRFYPSLQSQLNIPINKPEFQILEELPEIISIGVYRVDIEQHQFFSRNKFNLYTQYSIRQALEMGLKITLIQDGCFNSMIYKGKNISTKRLTKDYQELYELSKKVKLSKLIMNSVWGSVCEKTKKISKLQNDNIKSISVNDTIQRFNNSFLITQYSNVKPFKSNFARMGMFLTSKGRYELYKIISKHQDKIIYAHTDGFISTKRLKIQQGQNMGELRFEGKYENLEIKNKNYKSFSSFK